MAPTEVEYFSYLQLFIVFSIVLQAWNHYLDLRQIRRNREKIPPKEIKELVSLERFEKSQAYQVDKMAFSMFSSVVSFVFNLFEIIVLWPKLWALTGVYVGDNEYLRSIAWQMLTSFVGYPVSIPLELYSDFVIEARHGFNKKTLKLFVLDTIKGALISIAMLTILIPVVIKVVHWGGEHFYFYMWIVVQIIIFVFMFIYPSLIMPLFNKFEPLVDELLRKQIESLASSLNYPLAKLFQMDGSTRSAHSNAFLFGFWKNKRIVLYDTLLQIQVNLTKEAGQELGLEYETEGEDECVKLCSVGGEGSAAGKWNELHSGRLDELKNGESVIGVKVGSDVHWDAKRVAEEIDAMKKSEATGSLNIIYKRKPYTTEEILAILCHEIGHWSHGHVMKMLVVTSIHVFVIFRLYAFVMYSPALLQSFGYDPNERSIIIGLSIFTLMFSPVETVVGFGMTVMTRMNEYQADEFAVNQKRADHLKSGLRKLCVENLGDLNPDPWYAWFHHTHPALVERLRAIDAKEAEVNKKSN